jgi:hypothetical protein
MHKYLIAACTFGLITNAYAHVGLEQSKAAAGSYHKLTFKVGHGCESTGTHTFKVTLPEEAMGAKPMPKAGWNLSTASAPLSKPYTSHGKTIEKDVREVTWSGGLLPDAFYDEFSIQVKLTDTPGKVYFKVTQICEKGRWDWIDIPEEGQSGKSLKAPAPVLEVEAKTTSEHQH